MAEETPASSVPRGACAVKVELKVPLEEAWKLLGDWQKVEQCLQYYGEVKVEILEGENNTPNCVRMIRCTRPDGSETFAREKLLSVDGKNHSFTYELEENNFGFSILQGSFKLSAAADPGTSVVDWINKFDTGDAVPIDVAGPLMNEMYVATVKLAEEIYLKSVASPTSTAVAPAPAAAAHSIKV